MESSKKSTTTNSKSKEGGVNVPIPELKKKTITFIGSIALLVNNVTGGSMVVLPATFQQAGWVLPLMALFGIAGLSIICGIMVIECMTLVPGNNRFQKRLEYTNLAHIYFPTWLYWIAQAFYQLSILSQNISMIVQSVQVMDFTLVALTGYSCAIPQFSPEFAFTCNYPGGYTSDGVSPFGDWYLVSLGWLVTCVMVMPLGFIDLDDNDAVQKGGWIAVMAIVVVWCGLSVTQPDGLKYVTAFGGEYDSMMGTVLFNFAIVYTLPSWVNEKRPSVPIVKSLSWSMLGSTVLFAVLGYCGGAGFPPPVNNQTLMNQIYGLGSKISAITFFLFPACVNLTTIPVNSIMQRYNLKEAGVCGTKMAAFIGVVLPWLIAVPLYTGSGYQTLITWSGLILNSSVNFVFPPILYIIAIRRYGTGPNAIRTLHEEAQLTGNSLRREPTSRTARSLRGESSQENTVKHTSLSRRHTLTSAADISGSGVPLTQVTAGTGVGTESSKRVTGGAKANDEDVFRPIRIEAAETPPTATFEPIKADEKSPPPTASDAAITQQLVLSDRSSGIASRMFKIKVQPNATQPSTNATATGLESSPDPKNDAPADLASKKSTTGASTEIELVTPKPSGIQIKIRGPISAIPTSQTTGGAAPSADIASPSRTTSDKPGFTRAVSTSDYARQPPPPPTYDAATNEPIAPIEGAPTNLDEPLVGDAEGDGDIDGDVDGEPVASESDDEEERLEREHQARVLEKEEMRRQRTLKRLRKRKQKAEALLSNPVEIANEHEVIQPLDLSPPDPTSQPFSFAAWCICLPWHLCFYLTVPHSATSARFSRYWYVTFTMVVGWSVLISFFIVWSSTIFTNVTGFHAFPFGIFIVGFALRAPNLLTEYRSFQNQTGDLNRIFSNSVWQILICLPIPWIILSASREGAPFVVYSGSQAIFALTLFLLSALMLILFKTYDWYMLRPIGAAAIAIVVLLVLMVFLLDYNIMMDLSTTYCLPDGSEPE